MEKSDFKWTLSGYNTDNFLTMDVNSLSIPTRAWADPVRMSA